MADWPDWGYGTAVVVATGPSASNVPLIEAQGHAHVIVITNSWHLAPWADVLYGIDLPWWLGQGGVPDFKGIKVSPSPRACKVFGLREVSLVSRAEILTKQVGRLGCGLRVGNGHSGFQAINLAVQFGAKRIVMVGFDMRLDLGDHWHGHVRGAHEKIDPNAMRDRAVALDGCAAQFKSLGVTVVNCSPVSALKNYPKMSLREALL